MTAPKPTLPPAVKALQAAYGSPSQAGFGSAVFYEPIPAGVDLTQAALAKHKYFVGALWDRYGEATWLRHWEEVYVRPVGSKPNIIAELRSIRDPDTRLSVPMILDNIDNAAQACVALIAVYDDPAMSEVRVFNLGDGEAMSGILIAGWRQPSGDATFLVFLLD